MHWLTAAVGIAGLLLSEVSAFPAVEIDALKSFAEQTQKVKPRFLQELEQQKAKRTGFDPTTQYVDVTGAHAFVARDFDAGDQRGPCPGLNALANHNFLPHNGVADIPTIISAVNQVYGMALDLATFLAVYETVFDGNPLSLDPGYSIGGPTADSSNILGNLFGSVGAPQGLSGSHNKYEADTSPTRGDLYQIGNNYEVQVPYFQRYYDALDENIGDANAQYEALFDFRISRLNDSISQNPYFFFSPFAGVLVAPAGYNFPVRMMSNKSSEYPEGKLSKADLMSFFGITGESGSFQYTVGNERIPDNWYKRAIGDEYSIPGFLADVLNFAVKDPRLLSIGGNTGTVDSFTFVNITALTKGVFNAEDLTQGNNLECFVFQALQAAVPDIAGNPESNLQVGQNMISDVIVQRLAGLACPQLDGIDKSQYDVYPGAERSGSVA